MQTVMPPEHEDFVQRLASVSPTFRGYLERGDYLATSEESTGGTARIIMDSAIHHLLQEITELGLRPTVDVSELIGDMYRLEFLLTTRELYDKSYLVEEFKSLDPEVVESIEGRISAESDFGNSESFGSTSIELARSNPNRYKFGYIIDSLDLLAGSEDFANHVSSCIVESIENPQGPINESNLQEYADRYKEHAILSARFEYAVEKISNNFELSHDDNKIITDELEIYDTDKLRETKIFNESTADVEHHKNNKHHIEYYTKRIEDGDPINLGECILLVASYFAHIGTVGLREQIRKDMKSANASKSDLDNLINMTIGLEDDMNLPEAPGEE